MASQKTDWRRPRPSASLMYGRPCRCDRPSCCKTYVRASLAKAVEFVRGNLKIDLPGG
ncbi:MAG: hypothetical protein M0Z90_03505 [Desulfobacteraceae bacterium]|nr:hypothetical protein [Desulfobacteraceae bacterium]